MQHPTEATGQIHQAGEQQVKIDHLHVENRRLLLELITLYSKYAGVLQENSSLKSRTLKPERPAPPDESGAVTATILSKEASRSG